MAKAQAPALPEVNIWDDPEYAAENEKLMRLRADLSRAQEKLKELQVRLATARGSVRDAALRLLDNGVEEEDSAGLEDEIRAVMRRIEVLKAAEDEQRMREAMAHSRASRRICERLRPQYVDILRRMVEAALALGECAEEEAAFRFAVQRGGAYFKLPAMPLEFARIRGPEWTRLTQWLDEVQAAYGIDTGLERRKSAKFRGWQPASARR